MQVFFSPPNLLAKCLHAAKVATFLNFLLISLLLITKEMHHLFSDNPILKYEHFSLSFSQGRELAMQGKWSEFLPISSVDFRVPSEEDPGNYQERNVYKGQSFSQRGIKKKKQMLSLITHIWKENINKEGSSCQWPSSSTSQKPWVLCSLLLMQWRCRATES